MVYLGPKGMSHMKKSRTIGVWVLLLAAAAVLLWARQSPRSEPGAPMDYETSSVVTWITFLIPIILVLAFLLYFVRKARGGNVSNIMSLRRSPHREISAAESHVTFADVGGCDEAKEALADV